MKLKKTLLFYGLMLISYLVALLTVDKNKGFFDDLNAVHAQLPALVGLAFVSFGVRYARWYWLLKWSGSQCAVVSGWWAYLAGFALTATPGKVGELIRVRYFEKLGVSADRVVSAFIFERALDLVVVFLLASLFIVDVSLFWVASIFVFLFLSIVLLALGFPNWIDKLSVLGEQRKWDRLAQLMVFSSKVLIGCKFWIRPWPLFISLLLGAVAWSFTAWAFVFLLNQMSIQLPVLAAFATYPMAMLVGAASMLPGGLGSTEAIIIMQLKWHGVNVSTAILIAVAIRLTTLWFSVFCGLFAILLQEVIIKKMLNKFNLT